MLTTEELATLQQTGLQSEQYCYVLLEWVGLRLIEAREQGVLRGGDASEQQALAQLAALRMKMGGVSSAPPVPHAMA